MLATKRGAAGSGNSGAGWLVYIYMGGRSTTLSSQVALQCQSIALFHTEAVWHVTWQSLLDFRTIGDPCFLEVRCCAQTGSSVEPSLLRLGSKWQEATIAPWCATVCAFMSVRRLCCSGCRGDRFAYRKVRQSIEGIFDAPISINLERPQKCLHNGMQLETCQTTSGRFLLVPVDLVTVCAGGTRY